LIIFSSLRFLAIFAIISLIDPLPPSYYFRRFITPLAAFATAASDAIFRHAMIISIAISYG